MGIIDGVGRGTALTNAGVPGAATTEVQTITKGTATGGTWKIKYRNTLSSALALTATAAQVQAALRAMGVMGDDVVCGGGALNAAPVTVTFHASAGVGQLAGLNVEMLEIIDYNLTGGTKPTVAETTPGVAAPGRGCAVGALMIDTTNGVLYINTGTSAFPVWTKVGAQ